MAGQFIHKPRPGFSKTILRCDRSLKRLSIFAVSAPKQNELVGWKVELAQRDIPRFEARDVEMTLDGVDISELSLSELVRQTCVLRMTKAATFSLSLGGDTAITVGTGLDERLMISEMYVVKSEKYRSLQHSFEWMHGAEFPC